MSEIILTLICILLVIERIYSGWKADRQFTAVLQSYRSYIVAVDKVLADLRENAKKIDAALNPKKETP